MFCLFFAGLHIHFSYETSFLHVVPPHRPTHLHDRAHPLRSEIQRHFFPEYFLLKLALLFCCLSPHLQVVRFEGLMLWTSDKLKNTKTNINLVIANRDYTGPGYHCLSKIEVAC